MKDRSGLQQKKYDRILSDAKGQSPFGRALDYQKYPRCTVCGRGRASKAHKAHPPRPPYGGAS